MTDESSKQSTATGAQTHPDQHGAPSGKNPSDLLQKAISAAAQSTASISWNWYSDRLTCLQLVKRCIGINPKSVAMSQMYFVGANGQPIGTSLKALSSQWKILQHPDAPHEEGLEGLRMQKGWRWSRFRRQLEFALSGVQGDSSPLRLLAYSFFLPRSVVAELRDLITQHIIEKGPDGKVALIQSASVFAWKSIREPVVDDKDSAEVSIFLTEIRSAYESWTKQCSTLCQKVEKSMEKLESSFDSSNPIILLSRWSNLYRKAGHLEFSRIVEEESYLAGKLADTVGLKLDWSFRVLLHEFILQQCPRSKKQDTGFGALIKEVREKALSPQEVLSKLQNAALENHSSSIDKYLGLYLPKISLPPGVGNTGQPKRSLDRRDDHAQGSKRFRPSTTIRPVATTQLLKNADGSFKKASEVFSLAPSEISSRKQNGQCFKCGKRGHLAKDCPGSTGETPDEHKAGKVLSDASNYFPVDTVLSISEQGLELDQNRLSIVSVTVAQSTGSTDYCPARAGIDSMASVSLITRNILSQLHIPMSRKTTTSEITALNGKVSVDKECVICVTLAGHTSELRCLVVPSGCLPSSIDILIGKPDFPRLGISLVIPPQLTEQPLDGNIHNRDLHTMIRRAELELVDQLGQKQPLPGAPEYYGLLSRLPHNSEKDQPEQKYYYQILWEDARPDSHTGNHPHTHDFSPPLISRLDENQKREFRSEVRNFVAHHWWRKQDDNDLSEDGTIIGSACTFPVVQSQFKTTKCRPCTDCRKVNDSLPRASYEGFSISECLKYIRGNWNSKYDLTFLDLSKAFYRIHLGGGNRLQILTDHNTYLCDRVAFGLIFGPAALSGLVLLLLNVTLSGILGRRIRHSSTRQFVRALPGLHIIPYYDDIMIWGNPRLVHLTVQILSNIAPLTGSSFPLEKQDRLSVPLSPSPVEQRYRHLGCIWTRTPVDDLLIHCCAPQRDELTFSNNLSRREAFRIAGQLYDPLGLHPLARLAADRIRRWAGQSDGGNTPMAWNKRWPLDYQTREALAHTLDTAYADNLGKCSHRPIGTVRSIIAACDSSDLGWGFVIYGLSSVATPAPSLEIVRTTGEVLQTYAGEWDARSMRFHINRKEALTLQKTMQTIFSWLQIMLEASSVERILLYCDNSSAVSWAQQPPQKMRSYDHLALQRIGDAMADLKETIRVTYNVTPEIKHVSGINNALADQLSRSHKDFLNLSPLTEGAQHTTPTRHGKKQKKLGAAVLIAIEDDLTVVGDRGCSHRGALGLTTIDPITDSSTTFDLTLVAAENDSYDDLIGVGDVSEKDILDHLREAYANLSYLQTTEIVPQVSLLDLLSILAPEKFHTQEQNSRANALAAGSPRGPYFKWSDGEGLLLECDPLESPHKPTWRIVMITPRSRAWAMFRSHDHPLAGHQGLLRAVQSMRDNRYWWPTQISDTKKHIQGCTECQLKKFHDVQNQQPYVLRRWQHRFATVQVDWIGPFKPESQNDPCPTMPTDIPTYYCVMIDEGTHILLILPSVSTSARSLVSCLMTWISIFGPPRVLQMDNAGAHHNRSDLDPFFSYWQIEVESRVVQSRKDLWNELFVT